MSLPPGQPRGSGGGRVWAASAALPVRCKAPLATAASCLVCPDRDRRPFNYHRCHGEPQAGQGQQYHGKRRSAFHPTPTADRSALKCRVQVTSKQPRDHTTVTIKVHTAAHAEVTATSRMRSLKNKNVTGSSNANGTWALRLRVGDATPGTRVVVAVRVSRHGSTGNCQASFRPRAAAVSAAAAQRHSLPRHRLPRQRLHSLPRHRRQLPPPTTAASCYPLSDEGTCYEPGEYCRDDDHGMSGIAGDGENIVCEDNDGWRWEPA